MAGEYYNHTTYPATSATGSSSAMRSELTLIETGFDKLITLTGNANALMKVNAGVTAHEASIITDDGAVATVTGNLTVTGNITGNIIGTNLQAWAVELDEISGIGTVADNEVIVGTGAGTYAHESGATLLTSIGAQTLDTGLTSIAGLTTAADTMIYTSALDVYATTSLTATGRSILDDASVGAVRTTLGSTTVGDALFIAATVAAAQQAMDTEVGVDVMVHAANNAVTDVAQEFTATQNFNATTLTSTTNSVAWVASSNQVVTHTLTENTTFAAPSGLVDGAFYNLCIVQDASATGYTVAYNAVFKFPSATAPTLTTTASARDYLTFRSNGTNLYMVGVSLDVS